jgi:DNA-binding MarR family transcriptional regulator
MQVQNEYYDIMKMLMRVVNKFHALDRTPRDFGTGERLYMTEIHTIDAVGKTPDMNVTEIAETLGVTKGTLSPLVSRLAKRKYVTKFKGGANRRDVLLRLTPKGQIAYHGHEMFHLKMHAKLFEQFEDQPEFIRLLKQFLRVGDDMLDCYLEHETLEYSSS